MLMKRYNFLLLSIVLLFAACEKPVEVPLPPVTPKLSVNATLSEDKTITAWVGRSRAILEPKDPMRPYLENYVIKDATVVLYEDGQPFETLVYDAADYTYKSPSNKRVSAGKSYSIRVTAPGFAEVSAETIAPSPSEIAGVRWERKVRRNSFGNEVDEITLTLADPAEKNYYLVSLFGAQYPHGMVHQLWCVTTNDRDVEKQGYGGDPMDGESCFEGTNLLLKDDNFNGEEKKVKFYVESYQMDEYTAQDGSRIYRPYVEVRRITEDYFKYLKSADLYDGGDNPFAEPVNVYSNIKGGYGIFSAHTLAVDTLRQ